MNWLCKNYRMDSSDELKKSHKLIKDKKVIKDKKSHKGLKYTILHYLTYTNMWTFACQCMTFQSAVCKRHTPQSSLTQSHERHPRFYPCNVTVTCKRMKSYTCQRNCCLCDWLLPTTNHRLVVTNNQSQRRYMNLHRPLSMISLALRNK